MHVAFSVMLLRAAAVVIGAVTIVWTAVWLPLFLFHDMKEAMTIGIFPTLIGIALVVWILLFSMPSRMSRQPLG